MAHENIVYRIVSYDGSHGTLKICPASSYNDTLDTNVGMHSVLIAT